MPVLHTTRLIAALTALALATTGSVALAAPRTKPKTKTKTSTTSATKTGGVAARKPDLVIRALRTELLDSDAVRVRASVANIGRVAPKRAGRTTIVLSADTRLGAGDTILAEIRSRPGRGAAVKIDRMLSLPETLPSGDTYLVICADSGNRIAEARENNNCRSELLWEAGEFDEEDYTDDYEDEDEGAWDDEDDTGDYADEDY